MNRRESQSVQRVHVASLYGYAEGDQSKVDGAASRLVIGVAFRSGTADLEMLEMDETRKTSNESRDIRSGVEERWVLVGEEFCDVLVAVLCLARIGDVRLWRICEIDFLSGFWMD
jgi:hypothetical protein